MLWFFSKLLNKDNLSLEFSKGRTKKLFKFITEDVTLSKFNSCNSGILSIFKNHIILNIVSY
jgi:hypothetical protein